MNLKGLYEITTKDNCKICIGRLLKSYISYILYAFKFISSVKKLNSLINHWQSLEIVMKINVLINERAIY